MHVSTTDVIETEESRWIKVKQRHAEILNIIDLSDHTFLCHRIVAIEVKLGTGEVGVVIETVVTGQEIGKSVGTVALVALGSDVRIGGIIELKASTGWRGGAGEIDIPLNRAGGKRRVEFSGGSRSGGGNIYGLPCQRLRGGVSFGVGDGGATVNQHIGGG